MQALVFLVAVVRTLLQLKTDEPPTKVKNQAVQTTPQITITHEIPHAKSSVTILIRGTTLSFPFKISTRNYQPGIKSLCFDTTRNQQIITDIVKATQAGKKCLILTERKEHVDLLAEYLKHNFEIITMTGDLAASKKEETMMRRPITD